ncbi:MAG: class I SAM-dependent methyltransferase [Candidatus Wildermuthbacteria bacterium]|nr:class I SAM-dependent methyltransferase [Candidatus Wildermuthbacteria bacterium]
MAYTLLQEEEWKQKISQAAREQGPQAPQVIERSGEEYGQYFFEYFKSYVKKDNSKTFLLDEGCGTGKIAKKLADKGFRVYGVDFSQDIVFLAQQYAPQVNFRKASIYELPFSSGTFDIVICLGLFQTVADVKKAHQEIFRVLKPRGIVIIRMPNSLSIGSLFLQKSISFFNPYWFQSMLRQASLRPVALKGIYVFPSPIRFLGFAVLKLQLFKLLNFFFPFFVFFAHSFYIEAQKKA